MHRSLSLVVLSLTLTCAGAARAEGQPVDFLGMTSTVPADWVPVEPDGNMRLAEMKVPDAGGGEGAVFVLYYFGPGQGGSVDANVQRWVSQFAGPDGAPVTPVIEPLRADLPATLVQLQGSYARGVGVGPGDDALPDRMLLAGVVETAEGNLYPQMHGPAAVVAVHKPDFVAFIKGIRPASGD